MNGKHVGFTIEVLQDQGTGSTGTVTKCCVTLLIMEMTSCMAERTNTACDHKDGKSDCLRVNLAITHLQMTVNFIYSPPPPPRTNHKGVAVQ